MLSVRYQLICQKFGHKKFWRKKLFRKK